MNSSVKALLLLKRARAPRTHLPPWKPVQCTVFIPPLPTRKFALEKQPPPEFDLFDFSKQEFTSITSVFPQLLLPCPALPCPTLPYPALPCPALPCPALLCPALLCPALPRPARLLPYSRNVCGSDPPHIG